MSVRCFFLTAFLAIPCFAFGAVDHFEEDPVDNPDWELYEPVAGSTYTVLDGWWRVALPAGQNLDHWVTADDALQLRRDDIPENFFIETHLRFIGSGDPEDPVWPPEDEAYMASMMVYFSTNDVFYWGPQRGTNLVLQRTGQAPACSFDPGLQEVFIGIRKEGPLYSFCWKEKEDDPWQVPCTREAAEEPVYVGLLFKTWNPLITMQETFEFDYFSITELSDEPPELAVPSAEEGTDYAWAGMPYIAGVSSTGLPVPEISVTSAPEGMLYDPELKCVRGWVPETGQTVQVELEASNSAGEDSKTWNVEVLTPSSLHDDEFDEDPRENGNFWEFYEPQTGVEYSILEFEGSNWWHLDVPQTGDFGENFDTWTGADRAPQLRHVLDDPSADFVIETKLRYDPETAPFPDDQFLVGLMVLFDQFDLIHWHAGFERMLNGEVYNVLLERSGNNNLVTDYFPELLLGEEIMLRLQKKQNRYNAFYKGAGESAWHYSGSYETEAEPQFVGIIMKTWGDGCAFTADVDYFDILSEGDGDEDVLIYMGDTNGDYQNFEPNIADSIYLLNYLLAGGPPPPCAKAADINDDDKLDIADAISLLGYLFGNGQVTAPDGTVFSAAGHPGCAAFKAEEIVDIKIPEELPGCANPCTKQPQGRK